MLDREHAPGASHAGLHLIDDEQNAVTAAFNRGLLVLGAGANSIRFSPPLVLTREQADTAVRIIDEALTEVEQRSRC